MAKNKSTVWHNGSKPLYRVMIIKMIKGALFDIDSTLYSHKINAVPKLTLKLLHKLKDKGIKTGICTSRTVAEMYGLPKELFDLIDCKVMGTGSITFVDDVYYKSYPIEKKYVKKYIDYFNENNVYYHFTDINGDLYFSGDPDMVSRGETLGLAKDKVMFKQYEDEQITNLFYYHVTPEQQEYISSINKDATLSIWGDCGTICPSFVDKSFGLLKFCQMYSFTTDEIVACGDGCNDDLMLDMAGVGVATNNAEENTKKVADYICNKSIEDGGLYQAFLDLGIVEEDKKDIKMFFFDCDNTLYDHSVDKVRESTYEALEKLKKNGYKICLNTSRSYEECYNIPSSLLDLMDAIILLNGAHTIKDGKHTINTMPLEDSKKCIEYLDAHNITYRYITGEGKGYINQNDEKKIWLFKHLYDMTPPIKKYEGESLAHILYYVTGEMRNEIVNIMINEGHSFISIGGEIAPRGLDKAEAMILMGKEYGFTSEQLCAVGDGDNDYQMIKRAGISIAVGNGVRSIKDNADYVAESISNDGIYEGLKHFNFI